jgi:ribosome biogenesis protein SSF1/2
MKDFLALAGPLKVSHFLIFSQTERTLSMRLAKTPQGPTMQFRVESFCTVKDIQKLHVKPLNQKSMGLTQAPLGTFVLVCFFFLISFLISLSLFVVVMNNFNGPEKHLQLMTLTFQNMFPPINVRTVKLKQCTRVVLFHRNAETENISVRHYKIVLNPLGISKSIKRVAMKKQAIPLGKYEDMSEYVLSQTKASESDLEDESDFEIQVNEKIKTMVSNEGRKAAIRLVEIGPRIEMTLSKIQTGFLQGEVMYHWKGLDFEKLEEQRKKLAKSPKNRTSEFPGLAQVMKREREEEKEKAAKEEEKSKKKHKIKKVKK